MCKFHKEATGNRQQGIRNFHIGINNIMSEIKDFKDLKIWEKGMQIAVKCYSLTKNFPKKTNRLYKYILIK
ncbi:MAG: four helix bundle protein [Microcoleaceae cyanobacterium]